MTAFGDAQTKDEAMKSGATAYFDKPVRLSELKATVKQLLKPARSTGRLAPALNARVGRVWSGPVPRWGGLFSDNAQSTNRGVERIALLSP